MTIRKEWIPVLVVLLTGVGYLLKRNVFDSQTRHQVAQQQLAETIAQRLELFRPALRSVTLASEATSQPEYESGIRTSERTGWDSNPRYAINVHTLSRRAP